MLVRESRSWVTRYASIENPVAAILELSDFVVGNAVSPVGIFGSALHRSALSCGAFRRSRRRPHGQRITSPIFSGVLLKHPRADLHTEWNHFIDRQASALRVFAASFAVWRLKLAERVLTIRCNMASNPLKPRHLATDSDYLTPDLVELVPSQRRKCSRHDVTRHKEISLSEQGSCKGIRYSFLHWHALARRPYRLRVTA
jgi:hypothetical protein